MTQLSYASDQRAIRVGKTLAGLAILAALIAAVAGLSTAVFAVAALIYAQVKNLWQNAPSWVRVAAWAALAAAALFSIILSITQN